MPLALCRQSGVRACGVLGLRRVPFSAMCGCLLAVVRVCGPWFLLASGSGSRSGSGWGKLRLALVCPSRVCGCLRMRDVRPSAVCPVVCFAPCCLIWADGDVALRPGSSAGRVEGWAVWEDAGDDASGRRRRRGEERERGRSGCSAYVCAGLTQARQVADAEGKKKWGPAGGQAGTVWMSRRTKVLLCALWLPAVLYSAPICTVTGSAGAIGRAREGTAIECGCKLWVR